MTAQSAATAPDELWRLLQQCDALRTFSEREREALLTAIPHEPGMGVRRFAARELICRKGEYELSLCIVLEGCAAVVNDVDPALPPTAIFMPGSIFGELGAMRGRPRSSDVAALAPTLVFFVPRHALKYLEVNEYARTLLAERYREHAVRAMMHQVDLFAALPREFIDRLIPHCRIERHDLRGVPVVQQGAEGTGFYIVLDGFVQVVRQRDDQQNRVLAYLREGECFGEMSLLGSGFAWASVLTAGKCELIKIDKDGFRELCRDFPAVEQRLREVIARRQEQENRVTAELSELLEKSGQLGIIQAEALLVMDLDRCTGCDNCVSACESLHGRSRLIRNGVQIGQYLVPAACRHCDDPKCMNACPTGAVRRRAEGEIYFDYEACIGCGNCAIACPFDTIMMIDTPVFDAAQARKSAIMGREFFRPPAPESREEPVGLLGQLLGRGRRKPLTRPQPAPAEATHVPSSYPIKCDLCDGLPFMGCVHSCPTGAAMRIEAAELFANLHVVTSRAHVRRVEEAG